MWYRLLIGVALSFGAPVPLLASNIYVQTTSPDSAGKLFAYELREKISASSRHSLVNDENDAAFKIAIVTMDPDDNKNRTIYSVVLTLSQFEPETFDLFISSWVGVCGRNVAASCAGNVAAALDEEIQPIVEIYEKGIKSSSRKEKSSTEAKLPTT